MTWLAEQQIPLIRIDWKGNAQSVMGGGQFTNPERVAAQIEAKRNGRALEIANTAALIGRAYGSRKRGHISTRAKKIPCPYGLFFGSKPPPELPSICAPLSERVREGYSLEGDDMASITRRSPDIPRTDAHPNISRAC
jgi:hypothetical protein